MRNDWSFVPSFSDAVHRVERSNVHTTFASSHKPVSRVRPGELVHVETWDCYNGKINPSNPSPMQLKREELNPVTGPLYIEGAEPGDVLSVTLHDIRPTTTGVAICGSASGQLCHTVNAPWCTKFFEIDLVRNTVTMMEEENGNSKRIAPIAFNASPMLGVIGVAPAGEEAVPTMPAGKHGGNLDNRLNGIGCTLHLPVNHRGALLSIGDMHASQGDGEICGTGVEVGGDVLLSCQVIKRESLQKNAKEFVLEYPVTETSSHWITHGVTVENIPEATTVACEQAQKFWCNNGDIPPKKLSFFWVLRAILACVNPVTLTEELKSLKWWFQSCPAARGHLDACTQTKVKDDHSDPAMHKTSSCGNISNGWKKMLVMTSPTLVLEQAQLLIRQKSFYLPATG